MGGSRERGARTCEAYCVDGAVRGSMIGLMWGLFQGTYYGWQDSLRGRYLALHIGRNLAANSLGFAAFLGLYQWSHCSFEKSRCRQDWINAAGAGLLTGGVMGVPLAVRAGHPRLALLAAGITGGLTTTLDLVKSRRST